ncbi:C-terminal binding protein [Phytohabitans kaempferiae]|uniref:C-terminal binding protein n=1 Tax=Phytohabitans kaempferiae TaxID=1620943 RepID=A0ABV6MC75_9ACTN
MSNMRHVVVTDHPSDDVHQERAVAARFGVPITVNDCSTEAETVAATRGASALLVNLAPITAAVIEGLAPGASVIRYGIGYDNIDVTAARARGIRVANIPDYGAETVADHALALMLALVRRLPAYDAALRSGWWSGAGAFGPVRGLRRTTVGLIGTGRIGLAFAQRLRPLGVRIIAHDPYVSRLALSAHEIENLPFIDVIEAADVVSLHLPLTAQTHGLLGASELARMRAGALLINTSRGPLVDERALAEALQTGNLGGAGLDVFATEPLEPTSPLPELPNVILTPHIGYYSDESIDRLHELAAAELERALAGLQLVGQVA